jgi:fluoroquinolone transport system ATP-binding protein
MNTPKALRKSGENTNVEYSFISDGREIRKSCPISNLGISEDFRIALESGKLTNIQSKEQTLEDVFIALTGRSLK